MKIIVIIVNKMNNVNQYNTIHIFWTGDVQIITKDRNEKVNYSSLSTLPALVANIQSLKPADVTVADYQTITLFEGDKILYIGRLPERNVGSPVMKIGERRGMKNTYCIKYSEANYGIVSAFVTEVLSKLT